MNQEGSTALFVDFRAELVFLRHLLGLFTATLRPPTTRSVAYVKQEYDNLAEPDLDASGLYVVNGRRRWLPHLRFREMVARAIVDVVTRFGVRTVLDVGCGEGLNLAHLAAADPAGTDARRWAACDLVFERVRRAQARLRDGPKVALWVADASSLPLGAQAVDFAYTCHVLEQMPKLWSLALSELARVARYVCLLEPFYDRKGWGGRLHSRVHDYFQASLDDVTALGFEVLEVRPLSVQSAFNETTVAVLKSPLVGQEQS